MDKVDPARFPRLAAYLRFLPEGLASYPGCQAKGALVRAIIDCEPLADLSDDALPAEVRSLITTPPTNSAWIADAVYFGALLALADYRRMNDARYRAWIHEANWRLFKSPVYRVLLSLTSPGVLLTLCSSTWGTMHRGTTLKVVDSGKGFGVAELTFPERAYDRAVLEAIEVGLLVALEQSNVKAPAVTTAAITTASARFEARWS
ncbi:MAG TPA: hypothetical protein DFS52_04225 [Myxococcales bacterium]|jgi:hypothetical protein|nr:hypothetical protein [Myxococcales bacterium]